MLLLLLLLWRLLARDMDSWTNKQRRSLPAWLPAARWAVQRAIVAMPKQQGRQVNQESRQLTAYQRRFSLTSRYSIILVVLISACLAKTTLHERSVKSAWVDCLTCTGLLPHHGLSLTGGIAAERPHA